MSEVNSGKTIRKHETKKNDYSEYFTKTGERPQNFIRDIEPEKRFKDYPVLDQLIKLKDTLIEERNTVNASFLTISLKF